ncbi:MAG: FMN-binding protein [Rikenellaceae bacterium]
MIDRIKYIINIVIIALMFGAVAITRDGRIFGDDVAIHSTAMEEITPEVESSTMDGTRVINSTSLAKDVVGFAGLTPVNIYVKEGVITKVEALKNEETPSYFSKVLRSGFLDNWVGTTLSEAANLEVDVVSGATYSSRALAVNINRAVAYGASVEPKGDSLFKFFDIKTILGLVVILMGVVLTFLKRKSKALEVAYMVLNVAILGVWCGSFLSLAQVVSWMSNGFNISLPIALLLVVVLVPIFGRRGSYCAMHCPLGSAQELLGMVPTPKITIAPEINKTLSRVRYYIFMLLMFMMWLGVGLEVMNYELFSVFMVGSASTVVLVLGGVFLVLSLFVKRPYCRFVCPTGAMLTVMQKSKE